VRPRKKKEKEKKQSDTKKESKVTPTWHQERKQQERKQSSKWDQKKQMTGKECDRKKAKARCDQERNTKTERKVIPWHKNKELVLPTLSQELACLTPPGLG
jgi:hypothetical protein